MKETFNGGKDVDFTGDIYNGLLPREFIDGPGVEWVEIRTQHSMSCSCAQCGKETEKTWTPTITSGKSTTLIAYEPSYTCYACGTLFLDPYGKMESIARAIVTFTEKNDTEPLPLLEDALSRVVFQIHTSRNDTKH